MKRQKPSSRKVSAKKAAPPRARKLPTATKRASSRKKAPSVRSKAQKTAAKPKSAVRKKPAARKAMSLKRRPGVTAATTKPPPRRRPTLKRSSRRKAAAKPLGEKPEEELAVPEPISKPRRKTAVRTRVARVPKEVPEAKSKVETVVGPVTEPMLLEKNLETPPPGSVTEEVLAPVATAMHTPKDLSLSVSAAAEQSKVEPMPVSPTTPARMARKSERKSNQSPGLPAILLEGDEPEEVSLHGPGQKYAVTASQPGPWQGAEPSIARTTHRLPESYATGKLVLMARDPKCLHAQWDLSETQQRHYNSLSATGHLFIRVFRDAAGGSVAARAGVHPESRDWFVHVDQAGEAYVAQLGYQQPDGLWVSVATSKVAVTPPAARSELRQDVFVAIPPDVPLSQIQSPLPVAGRASVIGTEDKLAGGADEASRQETWRDQPIRLKQSQAPAHKESEPYTPLVPGGAHHPHAMPAICESRVPPAPPTHAAVLQWTPKQEQALSEFIERSLVRHEWMGSAEIEEVIRGAGRGVGPEGRQEPGAINLALESGEGLPSSPAPQGPPPQQGFWFNLNAELVIYGSTESDATVTIGGRAIRLRPDGSFSYRFALPDGAYQLPVCSVSADGTDGRTAVLKFSRQTTCTGDVGAHPQDPALKAPAPENLPS